MTTTSSAPQLQQQPGSFDLVIAGGGMTGAMLALQLTRLFPALRLAVVEQQPADSSNSFTTSFDSRSIALAAGSVALLAEWGLWPELKPHACAIEHIQVSDRGHIGKTRLDAQEFGRSALGYVIEIEWLGRLLYQKLQQVPAQQLHWFRPDQIEKITASRDGRQLQLRSGQQLNCRLLLLCEGGDSPSRALAGIDILQQDYQQTALIANLAVTTPHQGRAFERFTVDGPLALLPLTQQRYSLVWTCTPAEASRLQQLPESEFLAGLQRAFGHRAGVFSSVGNRVVYPLKLKTAAKAADHRLVLCGNSLHNLHPIAGQGFNLALRDLDALLQLLALPAHQQDPGAYSLTRQYQTLRQADMATVVGMTDSLVRLFSNDSKVLALGRTIGLTVLNHCAPFKQAFAAQSTGLSPLLEQRRQIAQDQLLAARQTRLSVQQNNVPAQPANTPAPHSNSPAQHTPTGHSLC